MCRSGPKGRDLRVVLLDLCFEAGFHLGKIRFNVLDPDFTGDGDAIVFVDGDYMKLLQPYSSRIHHILDDRRVVPLSDYKALEVLTVKKAIICTDTLVCNHMENLSKTSPNCFCPLPKRIFSVVGFLTTVDVQAGSLAKRNHCSIGKCGTGGGFEPEKILYMLGDLDLEKN